MKPTKLYRGLLCGMLAVSALSVTPVHAEAQTPDPTLYEGLGSDYIYVEDIESGQVLTEKNSEQKMYPASMTKMLTVIVALEHLNDMDEIIEITEQMTEGLIEQEASLAGFGAGDRVTVRDLLYGTALPSGADAANGLAFTVAGSIKNYVALMNEKAQEIGMANSHFANCTGLHEDDHYTTAHDMARLVEYCIQNEEFVEIFSVREYLSTPTYFYTNGIEMKSTTWSGADFYGIDLPGLIGSKTGFTYEAGHCLAWWAEFNGMKLVGVNAHCDEDNMYAHGHLIDTSALLNGLHEYEKTTIVEEGQLLDSLLIHYSDHDETVEIRSDRTIIEDMKTGGDPVITSTLADEITAGLKESTVTGVIRIEKDGYLMFEEGIKVTVPKEKKFFARLKLRLDSIFGKKGKD